MVILEDAKRIPVGVVALNAGSGIAVRELDRASDAVIDAAWIGQRLSGALRIRERLFSRPFYRLSHGEGDGLPGLVIDRMDELLVIQPNTAWAEAHISDIIQSLETLLSPDTIIVNRDSRGRSQEGLAGGREVVKGTVSSAVRIDTEQGHLYADIEAGQKTGVYFDQFPNHEFIAGLSKDAEVLDVFTHTGGFALSALGAGASAVTAIDSSEKALSLAAKAAQEMGVHERLDLRQSDAFDGMRALAEAAARFDIVVCDPPAFAPRKEALEAGVRAYERTVRLAMPLVKEGGILMICSCSHAVSPDALRAAASRMFHKAGRRARLIYSGRAGADHPVHPALPESGYLKALAFALD